MRWIIKPKSPKIRPLDEDERTTEKFLWWPKTLLNEQGEVKVRRWLERAKIRQRYYTFNYSRNEWLDLRWVDI